LGADDIVLRKGRNGQLIVKMLDFGRSKAGRAEIQADIQAIGAVLYEMLTGRARQGAPARAAQAGDVPEVAQSLVPAIPHALARVVDQALAAGTNNGKGVSSAKELAEKLAPFAISDRVPSLAPRETLMPFLSQEARRSRGMARLERAVLGIAEAKPSARPNLFVIEGSQERPRNTDRPSRAPHAVAARPLEAEDLIDPRIPRPPRTPKHVGGSVPRLILADRKGGSGHARRRSSLPLRRWKASRKNGRGGALARSKGMSPVAVRLWSAGLLAAAGLGAGLLLARLLHL
jgi:hypothetical protein